jgi:hypothetical protein
MGTSPRADVVLMFVTGRQGAELLLVPLGCGRVLSGAVGDTRGPGLHLRPVTEVTFTEQPSVTGSPDTIKARLDTRGCCTAMEAPDLFVDDERASSFAFCAGDQVGVRRGVRRRGRARPGVPRVQWRGAGPGELLRGRWDRWRQWSASRVVRSWSKAQADSRQGTKFPSV